MIVLKHSKLKGKCTVVDYKEQVMLDSAEFSISRYTPCVTGASPDRKVGACEVTEMTCTKAMDDAVVGLFQEATKPSNKKGEPVEICFLDSDNKPTTTYVLDACLITHYSVDASADGEPVECFTLNFTKIECKRGSAKCTFDLTTNDKA